MTEPEKPQKLPPGCPWAPAKFELADASAIQALAAGNANSVQQKLALEWILTQACRIRELSFWPDSARGSDLAEGRKFVGYQIMKLVSINIGALRKNG
jgi:hypothetical protein